MLKKSKLNNHFKQFTLIALLFISLFSCKKELYVNEKLSDVELETLKNWQNKNFDPNNVLFANMLPNWNNIYINKLKDKTVFEVDLSNPNHIFIGAIGSDKNKLEQDMAKNNIKMLLFKDNATDQIVAGCYMWLTDLDGVIQNMHYNNLNNFTGKLRFFNVNGSFSNGWVYDKGRITGKLSPSTSVPKVVEIAGSGKLMSTKNNKLMTVPAGECSPEYIPITGMACVGSGGYQTCTPYTRWEYIENHCNDGGDGGNGGDYYGSHGGGSGNGGENSSESNVIPEDPYMPGQDHTAINPKDYTKCFENIPDAGASFKIIVQVEEPIPGTSANYDYTTPTNGRGVGHTAITLTKTGADGSSITQTIGFYPAANKFKGPSKLVDNGNEQEGRLEPTINMTFAVDQNNFDKILAKINNSPKEYDLMAMNCTAFVVGTCKTGGIILPNAYTTVGLSGPGGTSYAMTPGGLGKAMRDLQNDNRINKTPSKVPQGKGSCNK